jgi:hypothetical protein
VEFSISWAEVDFTLAGADVDNSFAWAEVDFSITRVDVDLDFAGMGFSDIGVEVDLSSA